ncbi:unnamed protein product [Ambrosiozyma monospora]|uniref:Unnamed protein product n=1 Tax=Ambrosiozyma monospora TaxID=43982 RepID=A0A9W6Z6M6_AMBMO|nr:unnamed protein product [Ambrosiozyma monospora]
MPSPPSSSSSLMSPWPSLSSWSAVVDKLNSSKAWNKIVLSLTKIDAPGSMDRPSTSKVVDLPPTWSFCSKMVMLTLSPANFFKW